MPAVEDDADVDALSAEEAEVEAGRSDRGRACIMGGDGMAGVDNDGS